MEKANNRVAVVHPEFGVLIGNGFGQRTVPLHWTRHDPVDAPGVITFDNEGVARSYLEAIVVPRHKLHGKVDKVRFVPIEIDAFNGICTYADLLAAGVPEAMLTYSAEEAGFAEHWSQPHGRC